MSKEAISTERALKLALEALETVNRTDLSQVNLAIAAIKEALAEQAQRNPLTVEQAMALTRGALNRYDVVRKTEAAHNIKE